MDIETDSLLASLPPPPLERKRPLQPTRPSWQNKADHGDTKKVFKPTNPSVDGFWTLQVEYDSKNQHATYELHVAGDEKQSLLTINALDRPADENHKLYACIRDARLAFALAYSHSIVYSGFTGHNGFLLEQLLLLNDKKSCDLSRAYPITRTHAATLAENPPDYLVLPWNPHPHTLLPTATMNVTDKQLLINCVKSDGVLKFVDCNKSTTTRWMKNAYTAAQSKPAAAIWFCGVDAVDVKTAMQVLPPSLFNFHQDVEPIQPTTQQQDQGQSRNEEDDDEDPGTDDGDISIVPAEVTTQMNEHPEALNVHERIKGKFCDLEFTIGGICVLPSACC